MATTIINPELTSMIITIAFLTTVFFSASGFCWGLYRCVVWCCTRASERRARRFLSWFGNHDEDLTDSLMNVGAVDLKGVASPRADGVRGWTRVRRSNITEIAFSLADEAYLQFGRRDRSKANDLVTRKFLRDELSKFGSLRAKDKSKIIEIALTLAYVPPSTYEEMAELEDTVAYSNVVPSAKPSYR